MLPLSPFYQTKVGTGVTFCWATRNQSKREAQLQGVCTPRSADLVLALTSAGPSLFF